MIDFTGPESKLRFDPDFPSAKKRKFYKRTDGTCFGFKISYLAIFSSFFANLNDFSALRHDLDAPLVLPNATPPGLHLVLTSIASLVVGRELPDSVGLYTSVLMEALEVICAYDLPAAGTYLVYNYSMRSYCEQFVLFGLAAVTNLEKAAASAAIASLKYTLKNMPKEISDLLERTAPLYLVRLQRLHYTFPSAKSQSRFYEAMCNDFYKPPPKDYAKNCTKRGGCATKQTGKDFNDVVSETAKAIFSMLVLLPPDARFTALNCWVDSLIECGTCAKQTQITFRKALDQLDAFKEPVF